MYHITKYVQSVGFGFLWRIPFSLFSMTHSGNTQKEVALSRSRLLINMTNGVKLLYYRTHVNFYKHWAYLKSYSTSWRPLMHVEDSDLSVCGPHICQWTIGHILSFTHIVALLNPLLVLCGFKNHFKDPHLLHGLNLRIGTLCLLSHAWSSWQVPSYKSSVVPIMYGEPPLFEDVSRYLNANIN